MFSVDDFISILEYLKSGNVSTLDPNTTTLAQSVKTSSTIFFESTIDRLATSSDDYKRLRSFLIDWYSAHKTIISTQRNATDIYSLPESHLIELFKSFGFTAYDTLREMISNNKTELFLDLVNLYKIKGTPKSIETVLGYFGFSRVDLIEYWLKKNTDGNLVFSGERSTPVAFYENDISISDIPFHDLVDDDPHWLMSESQILSSFNTSKIRFPSKTPYFGIRPYMDISQLKGVLSILLKKCNDEYSTFKNGGSLVKDIKITSLNSTGSILEIYLACVYGVNKLRNQTNSTNNKEVLLYTGNLSYSDALIEYKRLSLNKNLIPSTYDVGRNIDLATKYEYISEYTSEFNTNSEDYFLTDTTSGIILQEINPDLKSLIDSQFAISTDMGSNLMQTILEDLSKWVYLNIAPISLATFVFGLTSTDYISEVINFFKPYRSRLIFLESIYLINEPLFDSVDQTDALGDVVKEYVIEWDTSDSIGSYSPDWVPTGDVVTSTPPIGQNKRVASLYVDSTGVIKVQYESVDSTSVYSTNITSNPTIGNYRIYNIYLYIDPSDGTKTLCADFSDTPETIGGTATDITSLPMATDPPTTYIIKDAYLNSLGQFTMVYNETPFAWPIDSSMRLYYSRATFDTGSFFDVGASSDSLTQDLGITVTDTETEILNSHIAIDSTSCIGINYTLDSQGHISTINGYNGFQDLDTGGFFDSPHATDVINIRVVNL